VGGAYNGSADLRGRRLRRLRARDDFFGRGRGGGDSVRASGKKYHPRRWAGGIGRRLRRCGRAGRASKSSCDQCGRSQAADEKAGVGKRRERGNFRVRVPRLFSPSFRYARFVPSLREEKNSRIFRVHARYISANSSYSSE